MKYTGPHENDFTRPWLGLPVEAREVEGRAAVARLHGVHRRPPRH
jgi:hypothetical protein